MTAEEIDRLTIGEVRAIAERATEVLEKMRAVQSLFSAPQPAPAAPQRPPIILGPSGQRLPERPPNSPEVEEYLASMRGERERIMAENQAAAGPPPPPRVVTADDFPPDIAEALRTT